MFHLLSILNDRIGHSRPQVSEVVDFGLVCRCSSRIVETYKLQDWVSGALAATFKGCVVYLRAITAPNMGQTIGSMSGSRCFDSTSISLANWEGIWSLGSQLVLVGLLGKHPMYALCLKRWPPWNKSIRAKLLCCPTVYSIARIPLGPRCGSVNVANSYDFFQIPESWISMYWFCLTPCSWSADLSLGMQHWGLLT